MVVLEFENVMGCVLKRVESLVVVSRLFVMHGPVCFVKPNSSIEKQ